MLTTWALWFLLGLGGRSMAQNDNFFFDWPIETTQCEIIELTWRNATAPYTAFIVPINSLPFIYDIPDEASSGGSGSYTIQLQLQQGAYYTAFMSDANGFGTGGSSEISIVGASGQTSCLNTASTNQTDQDFSFSVAGRARQCLRGFDITWDADPQDRPFNMSIIPLDQGFYPYDVELSESGFDGDWQVNMTSGTRYTIMMNSGQGYGKGGVGGVYEVDDSTRTDCILQEPQPTGSWPMGLATNTLASSTNPPDDSSSSITGGAIAGIVIGVLAFFALVGALVFFLLRRKRQRQAAEEKERRVNTGGDYLIDLGSGSRHQEASAEDVGTIEPYRSDGYSLSSPAHTPDGAAEVQEGSAASTAGLAGLGAAMGHDRDAQAGHTPVSPDNQAAPLPPKRTSLEREYLRIANPANPATLPTVPDGATIDDPLLSPSRAPRESRTRTSREHNRQPTFRRHEDAGRYRAEQEEVVDLPPLYTDIRRDGASDAGH